MRTLIPLIVLALACNGEPEPLPPLTVVSTVPTADAAMVPRDTVVQVVFSDTIEVDALGPESFVFTPTLAGALQWDEDRLTATFQPSGPLRAETPYVVRLTPELGLDESYFLRFTTEVGDLGDTDTSEPIDPASAQHLMDGETVTASVPDEAAVLRTYTLSTTRQVPDAPTEVVITERPDDPNLRSGDVLFDGLFALAASELDQLRVDTLYDGAFDNGNGVPCDCFETGESWRYVWTRDTAYAADLGTAFMDPARTRSSLRFKLSRPKGGGPLQIVQDTGTGGSWPVSTDRVVWALGARSTLAWLPEAEAEAFATEVLEALRTTLEIDREAIFDAADGLYRGEQSFLDWREQSYPSWTATDTAHIAASKALSTNTAHHILLRLAADLAAPGSAEATRWAGWADELAAAIEQQFWVEPAGLPSSWIGATLDPSVQNRWDQLALSLAVLEGVLDDTHAATAVRTYPHTPMGPPVLWPQQPGVPIYHNRGIWPFVTAYGLLSAARVGNDAVFDHDLESLVRGAAVHLSNMEAYEFLTQQVRVEAGEESGPVVNSRRQLWSVAGYLGAITRGLFGVVASADGLRIEPFVTASVRDRWLANTDRVELRGLTWRGRRFDLALWLPPVGSLTAGAYAVGSMRLDGVEVTQLDGLVTGSLVEITLLSDGASAGESITVVADAGDHRAFWAPPEPVWEDTSSTDTELRLTWSHVDAASVSFRVYRDGEVVHETSELGWTTAALTGTGCFALEAVYPNGHASQHSPPLCVPGPLTSEIVLDAHELVRLSGGGTWSDQYGRQHFMDWGGPGDAMSVHAFTTPHDGLHYLSLDYGNGSGGFTTGITAGHQRIEVYDEPTGAFVTAGNVVLPHQGDWQIWSRSSVLPVLLRSDTSYRLEILDAPNMSYLDHFSDYTGGAGGGPAPYGRVNLAGVVLLPVEPPSWVLDPAVLLDGTGDLEAYEPEQLVSPPELGAPYDSTDRLALDWDEQWLYLTLSSPAPLEDYRPWMIYLEAGETLDAPTASVGSDYVRDSVTTPANLPFTPTHQVTLRAEPGALADGSPWNGLWVNEGGWRLGRRLEFGDDAWLAADRRTLSVRVPTAMLGRPSRLRLVAHVIDGGATTPFRDLLPAAHAPDEAGGGGYLEIDLGASDHSSAVWQTP